MSRQALDDAQARYDAAAEKVNALQKAFELVSWGRARSRLTPCAGRWNRLAASVAFAETNLANTVIHAPVMGTILEREVEKGEFVTTSFVGERGAKGYVVSLADLNDLEVELDISQSDFAKLHFGQRGMVTTDAFPDRKYEAPSPRWRPRRTAESHRAGEVKIGKPDGYLRRR